MAPRNKHTRRSNKHKNNDKDDLPTPPADMVIDWMRQFNYKVLNTVLLMKGTDWINEKVSTEGKEVKEADWEDCYSYLLLLACRFSVPIEGVRWLIKNGADLRVKDDCGLNAMHCAVIGQDPFVVEALLQTDAAAWMLQDKDGCGKTPYEFADEVAEAYLTHQDCMNKPNPQIKDKLLKAQAMQLVWECAVKQEQLEAEERELVNDLSSIVMHIAKADINKFKSRVVATDRPIADNLAAAEEEEDEEELWRQYMAEQGQQDYENWRQFMAAQGRQEEHLTIEHYRRFC